MEPVDSPEEFVIRDPKSRRITLLSERHVAARLVAESEIVQRASYDDGVGDKASLLDLAISCGHCDLARELARRRLPCRRPLLESASIEAVLAAAGEIPCVRAALLEGPKPCAIFNSALIKAASFLDLAVCQGDARLASRLAEFGVPLRLLAVTDLLRLDDYAWPCNAEHGYRDHTWTCIKNHMDFRIERMQAFLAAGEASSHILETLQSMRISAQTLQSNLPLQSYGYIEASLSLLDVSILIGNNDVAARLASMRVPQIFPFGVSDFVVEGQQLYPNEQGPEPLMTAKGALRVEAALVAGLEWQWLAPRGLRSQWAWTEYEESANYQSNTTAASTMCHGILLDGAILGKQTKIAARLSDAGFVSPSLEDLGTSILRLKAIPSSHASATTFPDESRSRLALQCQVYLDKGMIDAAVAAGIVRGLKISPMYVFRQALLQHMIWPLPPNSFWEHPRFNPNQSPLAMAISLGNDELAKFLVNQGCEHMALTSESLTTDIPSVRTFCFEVTSCDKLAAARAAYSCAKKTYQVLLVQWARWCRRKDTGGVHVMHAGVLNLIAVFALAVPLLPELE